MTNGSDLAPTRHVTVVGDVLLDRDWAGHPTGLCPDSFGPVVHLDDEHTRPGGAALTAMAARGLGAQVTLVTAIGSDAAGERLRSLLAAAGVRVVDLGSAGPTPEKIRIRHDGVTVARLDRGCAGEPAAGPWTTEASFAVARADAVLLSDYGRGMVHHRGLAGAVGRRASAVVWDPHRSSRLPDVVVTVATPSEQEARVLAADQEVTAGTAARLAAQWSCAVAVTRGPTPVLLAVGDEVSEVPCDPVDGDPCGAGDWFAAGTAIALGGGMPIEEAVAEGCAAARAWIAGEMTDAGEPRGRVVATSGCFDVLHAGHVALLRGARAMGDRLVVLLNSDASVRQLKGPGRPVNNQDERAAVLRSLAAVDEVRIFDELTPCDALERLRPAWFVKGEDYLDADLPERAVLARWGGDVAFVPLVPGRSTTRVLELASRLTG
jgi:D-beta-D-heptose 7-phosphate kinase/D-beta-D-heptose 1-phosphate adenosyltransferase